MAVFGCRQGRGHRSLKLLFLFVFVLSVCPFGYTYNTIRRKQEINSSFCGWGRKRVRSEGQIFALKGDILSFGS